jgi:hypothetical protein
MAAISKDVIPTLDNLNFKTHLPWPQASVLDVSGTTNPINNDILQIDSEIWNMEQQNFTCSAPCTVMLPPWAGVASTVNCPRLTVSEGSWTSAIAASPLTVTHWEFEIINFTVGNRAKKADAGLGQTDSRLLSRGLKTVGRRQCRHQYGQQFSTVAPTDQFL